MTRITILVPVLGRPQNAKPLVDSIKEGSTLSTKGVSPEIELLFLLSPGDQEQAFAVFKTGVDAHIVGWQNGPGDWAKKINEGFALTSSEFCLLGADDLRFHSGWDVEALRVAEKSGAGVIGTNDLGNAMVMRGKHATHPLVRRSYVDEHGTIDEPGKCLHEGYAHQWVDNELVETAKARGQWAFAHASHVEHLHPLWRKGKMDSTYEKALSTPKEDSALFHARRRLWSPAAMRARASQS
jgi:hypothetical protein